MLHIILFILKIIGVILLSILGLLLALLLIVLFVPVRYQLRASHGEALYLKGSVSWLLHLVRIRVTHIDGVFHIRARILGFLLYDNLKPRKPKRRRSKRNLHKKKKRPGIMEQNSFVTQDDTEKAEDNNSEDIKTKDIRNENAKTDKIEAKGIKAEGIKSENIKTENINAEMTKAEDGNSEDTKAEGGNSEDTKTKDGNSEDTKTEDAKTEKIETEEADIEHNKGENNNTEAGDHKDIHAWFGKWNKMKAILIKLYHKLTGIPQRWKATYCRICDRLQSIRESFREKWDKLKDIIKNIRNKWDLIYDFLMDELNEQGMNHTWQMTKKLLKHILPTKLKSELIIGTGDPYSTGQVFSIICFFYGFYGDKVSVIPDFENSRFEGQHYARGRIRTATVLIIACRLLLDKRFKYLKNNFLILKEAL